MNFLAPLFLLGALAVAAPVVFHLIRHTTRERTLFSSLMFLPAARPRLTRRSRIEHLLLLALRCLALALLALGFARPYLRKTAAPGAPAAPIRRVVVLVDASASMRRTGLWGEARARAAAVLRSLAPGDEAAVFLFSRTVTPVVSFEEWQATAPGARAALALGRLAATGPGWEEDRLGDALIRGAEVLAETDAEKKAAGPRQIFLVSDLTAGSRLESLQAYDWPKNISLRVEALPVLLPTNAGLQLVAEAPDAERDSAPVVRVRVRNAANSTREQFRVGWTGTDGGAYLAPAVDVYVPPGQSRVVGVPALPRAADMRQIVLRGDDEDFDNTVYVAAPERQRWSVLYFGAEAAGDTHAPLFFLQRALPDTRHLAVTLTALDPGQAAAPAALADAKLVVVTGALADGTAAELHGALAAGKTILFAPRDAGGGPTLARLLALEAAPLADEQPADYAMFGDIDFQDPVFAPFADPHFSDFTKIHIWKYRRLAAAAIPGARVLARFDGGDPALVEVPVGAGRLLVLLTGWNPEDSQLAVSSKFVPLIQSILELAGGPADAAWQFFVGDPIPLRPGAAATVREPGGATVVLPAGAARYAGALRPGIYTIGTGPRTYRVAVNLAPAVSRTEPLAADELERYGAPAAAAPADAERSARRDALLQAADAESRQKLWRWLLGATLAVLLAESALAGWTTRRSDATVSPGKTAA